MHRSNQHPIRSPVGAREQRCRQFEGPNACAASIPRRLQPSRRTSAGRWHSFGGPLSCAGRRPVVMSYVQRVLQPGEQIRHISSIHWIVYWAGVGVALLAAIAYWLSETRPLTDSGYIRLVRSRSLRPFSWSRNGSGGGSPRSRSPTGASSTRKVSSGGGPMR
jgi:hypothetical protein